VKNGIYRVEVEEGKVISLEEAKVAELKLQMSNKMFSLGNFGSR
jgi:hypothetical protein